MRGKERQCSRLEGGDAVIEQHAADGAATLLALRRKADRRSEVRVNSERGRGTASATSRYLDLDTIFFNIFLNSLIKANTFFITLFRVSFTYILV